MSAIKREVTIGNCRLILGDCLEVLPTLGRIACERIRKAYAQPDLFIERAPEPKQEALL